MSRHPVYLTTAIPYVNAAPHVGFALELVLADALARFHRQRGSAVRFLSGTDENSLKNVQAAEALGVPTEKLVADHAERFRALHRALGISCDDFIRTSADPRHAPGVAELWRACASRGDLYRRRYRGLYCVGCEHFVTGPCPDHPAPPQWVDEENWFFRLSRYQDKIVDLLESGRLSVEPDCYRREVLAFARSGLEDFSVSRSRRRARGWGVPVPDDDGQITYVWFDALGNYLTALGYGGSRPELDRWWQPPCERIHVIGKGITRFHALYWPALLLSAGLPVPNRILVHGYLTLDGRKISKSSEPSATLDPFELVARFGRDAIRYHLLRHTRPHQDADVTVERVAESYRGELADQLGNLLQRVEGLAARRCDGLLGASDPRVSCLAVTRDLDGRVAEAVDSFRPDRALDAIFEAVATGNRYLEVEAPWRIDDPDRRRAVLGNTSELLRRVARSLTPFLPDTAAAIRRRVAPGRKARPGPPLFPRLDG